MKRLINILIVLVIPISGFTNGFPADRLIWNGDTLTILSSFKPSLLELRNDIDSLRSELFREEEAESDKVCRSSYIAEWTVIENEIFLTNVYCPNYYHDSIKADLKSVFGDEYEDGKVKATWVTDQIVIPKGKLIHYIDRGHQFYESELVLIFKNGRLIEQKEYNSKSYKSVLSENQDSLQNFIYSTIDWEKVPDLKNEKVGVIISFSSGETRKPDRVQIARGSDNEILNQEALRVVKLIPEWNVYHSRGIFFRITWTVPIIFDEQNRMKYAH